MGAQVVMGAVLQCSFGVAPSSLVVLPTNKVMAPTPAANILDNKPMLNIPPFGMCQSMANPTVAAATAAALGVLTPMPCVPATAAPWVPGCPKLMVGSAPALESNSKLMCSYGGVIQVVSPGQMKVIDG
ncbi:DUF4280 domain-containing protein [Myxococcus sp. K15C18031901]|uniref:DUF4280 domain-containing protein n=1 Tax=Myxococcus dinghuensis TaxID=2906761 RepID=UPI0020A71033|nr:DUF4280 domain-containing protein [Myxococcus dinghuensis]MCP3101830.1 DUF4280 domain-containing protein [Myxococcus dinghuensis]